MATTRQLNILITGGAHGIGQGLFRHFLCAGHRILVLDSNEHKLAYISERLLEWSSEGKGLAVIMKCDLRNRDSIRNIIKSAETLFDGRLDVLINNIMTMPRLRLYGKAMDDLSEAIIDEWDTTIAVSLTAPFLLSRLCVPLLMASSTYPSPGCIINISPTNTYNSGPNHEAYSATQAGLLGLSQSMSVSLSHTHKIRVNTISIGWIHVMIEHKMAHEKVADLDNELEGTDVKWHSAGRVGLVENVCKAVEYLMGAEFVTGQEIVLGGSVKSNIMYP
jgi:NAD(P)-dependent dehydrogenase (short-subunit alcohol dehydrogenase family)